MLESVSNLELNKLYMLKKYYNTDKSLNTFVVSELKFQKITIEKLDMKNYW